MAALWAQDGDYMDLTGRNLQGRAAIESAFQDFFTENKGTKLRIDITSLRFVNPDTAVEDGITTLTFANGSPPNQARYTNIHIKQNGQWFLQSAREASNTPPGNYEHLRALEWAVGQWVDEGNGPEIDHVRFEWSEDGNFLISTQDVTSRFRQGRLKDGDFESFTISWMPYDFDTNPHLRVFEGFGSLLDPKMNRTPNSIGRNFTLDKTLKFAVNVKNAVGMWGPYEVDKEAFDLAAKRKQWLDGGTIGYRADDRLYHKNRIAINCFHAMAALEELYPDGGFLGTGFKIWGINGTARVLIEYTKGSNKDFLLESVDTKKDLYGFVYAPKRNSHGLYNPFPNASAYFQ